MSGDTAAIDESLPFVFFALAIGIIIRFLETRVHGFPPFTLAVFIVSFAIAGLHHNAHLGMLGTSIEVWSSSHPHVILFGLLPPLLYESAAGMDFHVLKRVIGQSIILASLGAAANMALTALVIKFCLLDTDWSWSVSFMVGSIMAATDPVAVVAVLHTLGAPKRLSSLIEGESLLNDGSAFVLFLIFKDLAAGEDVSVGGAIGMFAQLALGGPAWGLLCAFVLYVSLNHVYNDLNIETTLILLVVYVVFFIGEAVLHVSGVLATVTLGIFWARHGKYALTRTIEAGNHQIWKEMAWLANTLIFAVSGLIVFRAVIKDSNAASDWVNWVNLIIIYIAIHVIRALVMLLFMPILVRLGYGMSWKEAAVAVYGGLRGAVGLALMLLVADESHISNEIRDLVSFHVSGIVCLTLLINGSTAGMVYKALNVYPENKFQHEFDKEAIRGLLALQKQHLKMVQGDWFFNGTDWRLVRELVPNLKELRTNKAGHYALHVDSVHKVFRSHKLRKLLVNKIKHAISVNRLQSISSGRSFSTPKSGEEAPETPVELRTADLGAIHVDSGSHLDSGSDEDTTESPITASATAGAPVAATPPVPPPVPPPAADAADASEPTPGSEPGPGIGAGAVEHGESKSPLMEAGSPERKVDVVDDAEDDDDDEDKVGEDSCTEAEGGDSLSDLPAPLTLDLARLTSSSGAGATATRRASLAPPVVSRPIVPLAKARYGKARRRSQVQRLEELYVRVFEAAKAMYEHEYEENMVGGSTLLRLSESADVAKEFAQSRFDYKRLKAVAGKGKSGSMYNVASSALMMTFTYSVTSNNPVEAQWHTLFPAHSLLRLPMYLRKALGQGCLDTFTGPLLFEHVQTALESLRTFVCVHEEIANMSWLDPIIKEQLHKILAKARLRFVQIKSTFPGMVQVVQAVSAAKALLFRLHADIICVAESEGLINDHVRDDLLNIVDGRMDDLETYLPSPFVIGYSSRKGGVTDMSWLRNHGQLESMTTDM